MMTKALSPFSARAIEENRGDIPQVLIDAWKRTMRQDPIGEAIICRRDDDLKRRRGLFMLTGALFFAVVAIISLAFTVKLSSIYLIPVIVCAVAAVFCALPAVDLLAFRSDRSRAFELYHIGFGSNISSLCNMLQVSREQLKSTNLMEAATAVLDVKAREFVVVERSLMIGLGRRLKRQDWKFDPAWNNARGAFSAAYDMFERFELVEPVEKKGDEWKPYIARAEAKLASEEDSLGP